MHPDDDLDNSKLDQVNMLNGVSEDKAVSHPEACGHVIAIRGSVVDIQFEQNLPAIYSVLYVKDKPQLVLEVYTQININRVRAIALTPTEDLAHGMTVLNTGQPLKVPVGKSILSQMFNVFYLTSANREILS